MSEMDWLRLLCQKRFRGPLQEPREDDAPDKFRSAFSKDADRIIYSSAFRRLQDKTQVHPFPETDYIRTRLTHSLEASSVGRSLGIAVGDYVLNKHKDVFASAQINPAHFGVIVETACLAHDLGNPPFGHAGEDAIRHWFRKGPGADLLTTSAQLTDEEQFDLQYFEGNAQGFRVLTRLQGWREEGGLQLSCATLGAFMKYPMGSIVVKSGEETRKPREKFGYFKQDREAFATIAKAVGLLEHLTEQGRWSRHPLALLVEAADDICYLVVDIEDAYKAKKITFKQAEDFLKQIAEGRLTRYHVLRTNDDKVAYLRAKAIGVLVEEVVRAFWENDEEILRGEFGGNLNDCIKSSKSLKDIRSFCREKLFTDPQKLEAEAAGYEVISGLLKIYSETLEEWERTGGQVANMTPRYQRTVRLLPNYDELPSTRYQWLLRVTDYVSGMTDGYAVKLYRKLKGITLGTDFR